jgi:hypothetical protein
MRLSFLNIFFVATILLSCSLLVSCDKVNVTFDNINQSGDPDITFYQNYQASLQTLQLDSFLTSGQGVFTVGYNNDPELGKIHAGSYVQFGLPAVNPFLNQTNISFDSIEIVLKSKANFYGDTTKKFYFKIFPLTELIQNTTLTNNNYYNTRSFGYDAGTSLVYWPGEYIIDTPGISTLVPKSIRLSQALGLDLFNKLQTGDHNVSTQALFLDYFKGLHIDVDTDATNTLYSFTDSLVLRLDYDLHGLTTTEQHLDFDFVGPTQFNHIAYDRSSLFPAFPVSVNNVSLLPSSATHNKAYLSSTTGTYIKITFPDLLNLKALHPYVKVVSAQLIVPPTPGTYNYPYNKLPPNLSLYETNDLNVLLGAVAGINGASQTGNLFIDNLSGQNTSYSYDITNFISFILNPPANPTAATPNALLISPSSVLGDESLSRLIIDDQTNVKGIQLKLYVLGL